MLFLGPRWLFSPWSSQVREAREVCGVPAQSRGCCPWDQSPPKGPTSYTVILRLGSRHMNLRGEHKHPNHSTILLQRLFQDLLSNPLSLGYVFSKEFKTSLHHLNFMTPPSPGHLKGPVLLSSSNGWDQRCFSGRFLTSMSNAFVKPTSPTGSAEKPRRSERYQRTAEGSGSRFLLCLPQSFF